MKPCQSGFDEPGCTDPKEQTPSPLIQQYECTATERLQSCFDPVNENRNQTRQKSNQPLNLKRACKSFLGWTRHNDRTRSQPPFADDSMPISPPSTLRVTLRPARPVICAATAVAQQPVPHARVSPQPRSQTRMVIIVAHQHGRTPRWSFRGIPPASRSWDRFQSQGTITGSSHEIDRMGIAHGNARSLVSLAIDDSISCSSATDPHSVAERPIA